MLHFTKQTRPCCVFTCLLLCSVRRHRRFRCGAVGRPVLHACGTSRQLLPLLVHAHELHHVTGAAPPARTLAPPRARAIVSLQVYKVKIDPKESVVKERLVAVSKIIQNGAKAYLFEQYKWLALWVACLSIIIGAILRRSDNKVAGLYTMICYIVGSILSGAAGYLGMYTATSANARTAQACEKSIAEGLQVAFASGAVMGNGVVGLALIGLWFFYLLWAGVTPESRYSPYHFDMVWGYIAGFGFGASSIGMFARVGGGVFTKAADVPEDDARNPAVVADNVGDNVGDVAGMGADLFESYAGALIACATLSPELYHLAHVNGWSDMTRPEVMMAGTALPFWVYGFGVMTSLFGIELVRRYPLDNEKTTLHTLLKLINWGVYAATIVSLGTCITACVILFDSPLSWRLFGSIIIGLFAGIVISQFTEYCTSYEDAPTQDISAASEFGPAPVIIKGLGVGMMSVSVPTIAIVITILACNALAGLYGVSIAAVGMLCTLSITLATDAYGPVADNAGGLAEMAGMPAHVRSRTDRLDSLGNTTAATGKGLAIGSALLTAIGLIAAFLTQSGVGVVDLKDAITLSGVLIGCGLPFVFGALTMLSVDRGARSVIVEVRRQFAMCPQLLELPAERAHDRVKGVDGQLYPDSQRCVQIATEAAIQEMVLPGVLAVFVPVAIGFLLGPKGLGGLLAGGLGTCFMLALTMANAGGAWDNAKKWCEKSASEGEVTKDIAARFTFFGIKSGKVFDEATASGDYSKFLKPGQAAPQNAEEVAALRKELEDLYHERHAATVTGDTVGDPFKDTSGPALNVLSKTMTMVSLMLAPAYRGLGQGDDENFDGFRPYGTIIAAVMLVVIGIACYVAVSYFGHLREKRDRAATDAKNKANAARST
ncbi:sodium-translocating pyrophosphatase, partial [archaeon]